MSKIIDILVPFLLLAGLFSLLTTGTTAILLDSFYVVLLLWLLLRARRQGHLPETPPGWLPLLLVGGFILFQLVPLSPWILQRIAPHTAEWYSFSAWEVRPGAAMPLSLRSKSTLLVFFRWAAGAALLLVTIYLLSNEKRLKYLGGLLGVAGGIVACWRLGDLASSGTTSGWVPTGFFPMLLPLAFGFFLAGRQDHHFGTVKERFSELFRHPGERTHLWAGLAILPMGVAVILESRQSWAYGSVFGLLTMGVLLLLRREKRASAIPLFLSATFLAIGNGTLAKRPMPDIFAATGDSFFSIFGTGLGTHDLVPAHWDHQLSGTGIIFMEMGYLGTCLALFSLLFLFHGILSSWKERRRRFPLFVGAGALSSLCVAVFGAGSAADPPGEFMFFLFFLLAGLATAAVRISSNQIKTPRTKIVTSGWSVAAVGMVLLANLLYLMVSWRASYEIASGEDSVKKTTAAIRLDPLEDSYLNRRGEISLEKGFYKEAAEDFSQALRWSPLTGEYLQNFARTRKHLGRSDETGRLLKASLHLGTGIREGYFLYSDWLLDQGRKQEVENTVSHALQGHPADTASYLELLERHNVAPDEIRRMLPLLLEVFIDYGSYLEGKGEDDLAAEAYREALAYTGAASDSFMRLALHLEKSGLPEEALAAIQKGIDQDPRNPDMRRLAIEYYENLGLNLKAEEEKRLLELLVGGKPSI